MVSWVIPGTASFPTVLEELGIMIKVWVETRCRSMGCQFSVLLLVKYLEGLIFINVCKTESPSHIWSQTSAYYIYGDYLIFPIFSHIAKLIMYWEGPWEFNAKFNLAGDMTKWWSAFFQARSSFLHFLLSNIEKYHLNYLCHIATHNDKREIVVSEYCGIKEDEVYYESFILEIKRAPRFLWSILSGWSCGYSIQS